MGFLFSFLILTCDASTPECSSRYADKADAKGTMVTRLDDGQLAMVYISGRVVNFGSSSSDVSDNLRTLLTENRVAS